ncbi:MAG: heavy-metal-associated domain-containing protein [Bradyrhizobium sp.]|uniref:heavy-metal-associated domain-containing protein n=1 Tax=Bradyrhizobium sp. TaxID=376 RepID=UPI001C28C2D2|nr:heavy metal-associated domain-containing protein [Bradyrhizobium sp.]MBU6464581.1 heavy-metal-associated domain-containing protein [Pseudomonadota bacterium]MDE2069236.1 heavy-metal-associated domain-containing protein [Bradyrhizobium sp.]MDE2242915.1 heavy-metal-associated domain-containing protein [Bradyrhizobium sp.]MDE2469512.1 heavy-metal-associated domain-containing protein [Bradyrhizobium sp.]
MDELDAENSGGNTLSISGMTCNGCANTVTRVLSRVLGVESANVDFENGRAVVTGTARPEVLINAVEATGYGAHITQEKSTGGRNERGRSGGC